MPASSRAVALPADVADCDPHFAAHLAQHCGHDAAGVVAKLRDMRGAYPRADLPLLAQRNSWLATLLRVFPDCDPADVRERLLAAPPGALLAVAGDLAAGTYKRLPGAHVATGGGQRWTRQDLFRSPQYIQGSKHRLYNQFRVWTSTVDAVMAEHNNDYAASHRALSEMTRKAWFQGMLVGFMRRLAPYKSKSMEDPELLHDVELVRREAFDASCAGDRDMALKVNHAQYEEHDQLLECLCCLDDAPFENFVQCSHGHLICKRCVERSVAEFLYGQGTHRPARCLAAALDCTGEISHAMLASALTPDTLRTLTIREAGDHLRAAAAAAAAPEDAPQMHLAQCPFCPYAEIVSETQMAEWAEMERLQSAQRVFVPAQLAALLRQLPPSAIFVAIFGVLLVMPGAFLGAFQIIVRLAYYGVLLHMAARVTQTAYLLQIAVATWADAHNPGTRFTFLCMVGFHLALASLLVPGHWWLTGVMVSAAGLCLCEGMVGVTLVGPRPVPLQPQPRANNLPNVAVGANAPQGPGMFGLQPQVVPGRNPARIFHCRNPDCGKTSCLRCEVACHPTHHCRDPGQGNEGSMEDLRKYVETAMSQALVRVCPVCQVRFCKDAGCNLIVCPRCKRSMCYVCRKDISEDGYTHFCPHFRADASADCARCNKCHLYKADEDQENMNRVGARARQEYLAAHPHLTAEAAQERR